MGGRVHRHCTSGRSAMEIVQIEKKLNILSPLFNAFFCTEGYIDFPRVGSDGLYVYGFFQSERFFSNYSTQLKEELRFVPEVIGDVLSEGISLRKCESVCVHVRVGDYKGNPVFDVCSADYYCRAVSLMKTMCRQPWFYVFSDDAPAARQMLAPVWDGSFRLIPAEFSDWESLYLGTCCRHFVIPNSSFSWWMQYLSDSSDKIVIAPSKWYVEERPCAIYQKEWLLIDP